MANKKNFESALAELESILKKLESGSQDLNKMLELFEKGMELTHFCKGKLEQVEDRVTTLVKEGETLKEEPGIVSS